MEMECDICTEEFDTGERLPKLIQPCTHTACLRCLRQLRNRKCPMCRQDFKCKPKRFPSNWSVLELLGCVRQDAVSGTDSSGSAESSDSSWTTLESDSDDSYWGSGNTSSAESSWASVFEDDSDSSLGALDDSSSEADSDSSSEGSSDRISEVAIGPNSEATNNWSSESDSDSSSGAANTSSLEPPSDILFPMKSSSEDSLELDGDGSFEGGGSDPLNDSSLDAPSDLEMDSDSKLESASDGSKDVDIDSDCASVMAVKTAKD